jgi:predicted metal-dependent hydrolase
MVWSEGDVVGELVLQPRDVRFEWAGLPLRWLPGEPVASHVIKAAP